MTDYIDKRDVTPAGLRALAKRLRDRRCAPSLEGYRLVDGLLAAADLIEGQSGPMVHASSHPREFERRIQLARLLRRTTADGLGGDK